MIKLTKARAEELMRSLPSEILLPDDWQIANEDIAKMEILLTEAGATDTTDDDAIKNFVQEVFRYDSKTHRIMSEGYEIGNAREFFINEEDAVEWLNNHRIPCTTFDEGVAFIANHRKVVLSGSKHQVWFDKNRDYFFLKSIAVMEAVRDVQQEAGYWNSITMQHQGLWISLKNGNNDTQCTIALNNEGMARARLSGRYDTYNQIIDFTADAINDFIYQSLKDIYLQGMSSESKQAVDLDTLVLAPLKLTRPQLQDLASTITLRNTHPVPDDWAITDDEATEILFVLTSLGANAYTSEEDLNLIMGECFRLDTKTHRIMTAGYLVDPDLAWFIKEEDAVEWLNANGMKCSTFKEAQSKRRKTPIKGLYEAGWFDTSYRFNFNTCDNFISKF